MRTLRRLLESGAVRMPEDGVHLMTEAALEGQAACLALLLDHGAPIDRWEGEFRSTALMDAISFQHDDAVELLLLRGANPSQPDSKGRTALHYAAAAGEPRYVEWMLMRGANVHAVDELERTALMEACLEDTGAYHQCRMLLLLAGSSTTATDCFGMTASEILRTIRTGNDVDRVEY